MLYLNEFKKNPDRLSDLLPWAALISPSVVLCKDGSFLSIIKFRGRSLESVEDLEKENYSSRLNNVLKRLGSGFCLWVEARTCLDDDYPGGEFENEFALRFDDDRKKSFVGGFSREFYITLEFLPNSDKQTRVSESFLSGSSENVAGKNLESFENEVKSIASLLSGVFEEAKVLDDSGLLSYLQSTVSICEQKVSLPRVPMYLDSLLGVESLETGMNPKLGDKFLKVVSVRAYPTESSVEILKKLNELNFLYRYSLRFIPLGKVDAERELFDYKRKWFSKRKSVGTLIKEAFFGELSVLEDSAAVTRAEETSDAQELLASDDVSFGYLTISLVVFDSNYEELSKKTSLIEQVFNEKGFVARQETFNAVDAWLGSIPGNARNNVRRPILSSRNLADFILTGVYEGDNENCLFVGKTDFGKFYYPAKYQDVGHTLVLGPTGSGKSYFLSFLALQFLRQKGAQVFFFDKGKSSFDITKKVGGSFFDIKDLSFQVLKDGGAFCHEFILDLLESEAVLITSEVKEEVWKRLKILAGLKSEERTLENFVKLLQDLKLRSALSVYSNSGAYGNLFNGVESVDHENYWQVYELENLMQIPRAIGHVLKYLFYKLESKFSGVPTLLILDEAWIYLDDERFSKKIREWLKTLRKKNVSVIFATQSIADVVASKISASVLESCPVKVYLPNFQAMDFEVGKYYEALGLNKKEIEIISEMSPKQDYYYTSPEGRRVFGI